MSLTLPNYYTNPLKIHNVNRMPPRNGKREEKLNTLLVDGNALFKTGFFGASSLYNRNAVHIGGLYQFITVLRKLLNEDLYHQVYVFWDGKFSGKLRYEIYNPYKSARGKDYINGTQPIDPEEVRQKNRISTYLEELFIRQISDEIVESDDYIAYYCNNKKEHETITICTNDSDMAQLINDQITIYFCNYKIKDYVTPSNFNTYFDFKLENTALIKSIAGDNADSIKGIKGVKETTLLNIFPELKERKVSLEEILIKANTLQEERVSKKLKPLKTLTHILEGISTKTDEDGNTIDEVLGMDYYDLRLKLVDLTKPMMTERSLELLNEYVDAKLNPDDRGIKNVYTLMKEDGIDTEIGEFRYADYLMPFKKLMEREMKK